MLGVVAFLIVTENKTLCIKLQHLQNMFSLQEKNDDNRGIGLLLMKVVCWVGQPSIRPIPRQVRSVTEFSIKVFQD
jgi:hypothetical protein